MTDIKMGPVFQVTALANIELLKSGQITRKYCHFFFFFQFHYFLQYVLHYILKTKSKQIFMLLFSC